MDITKLTLEELKALAYDQIMLIQQSQNNLNLIQAEIEKRKGPISEVKDDECTHPN